MMEAAVLLMVSIIPQRSIYVKLFMTHYTSLVVMGASVLHLEVTESGSVGGVEVIQALGDYTQATVEAVKKWNFVPARNETDKSVASDAFAICVYRPLQNPREP
jgi:hypothetical protein